MTTTLTLSRGNQSQSITSTDAKADPVLDLFVAATKGPTDGTLAEKQQHVLAQLRLHLLYVVKRYDVRTRTQAAQAQAQAIAAQHDWSD